MFDLHPALIAALTGFTVGVILCVPVGPVNLTIIHEGARNGFRRAAMISLGATLMEVIYCALAFTGFATFFSDGVVNDAMQVFSFAFMLYLGIKFLLAKTLIAAPKFEQRIESKLHPHTAFWIGFVRVLGNPGVFVFWILLAVNLSSRGWVQKNTAGKLACIGGMALATGLWFIGLSWAASLGHRKFSDKTLLRMEHVSGVLLLILAFIHGGHIIWQLSHRHIVMSP